MPCYDSRNDSSHVRERALAEFRHNSPVAMYLCDAMKLLTAHGLNGAVSPGLAQWWEEHQEHDG